MDQSNPYTPSKLFETIPNKYSFNSYSDLYIGNYNLLKQVCPLGKGLLFLN